MTPTTADALKALKAELQREGMQEALENLAAALTGRMLNVPVTVARSGFQHGGDAGPAGRSERRFRVECKKYSDGSSLNRRELLGEIDHALMRDEALEAWILVATRSVSEQVCQDLHQHAESIGVPVLIWDWSDDEIGPLAALCAYAPDVVESLYTREAAISSRDLVSCAGAAIEALKHQLQAWCIGYSELRRKSHERISCIWNSSRTSNAEMLQDVAGGERKNKIRRAVVHEALSQWWVTCANSSAPAVVVGLEGVGKTWAIVSWMLEELAQQPIVVMVTASAASALSGPSATSVSQFLADRIHEITGVRDRTHWQRRLDRLLGRPIGEGPVLTVCFDGINQEPSLPWLHLLKVLQGDLFAQRVRVILSCRNSYFSENLARLQALTDRAVPVPVEPYSLGAGGELEQMLAFYGLRLTDLHSDLVDLARRPRLFSLVMEFGKDLVQSGQVTVHRLLWEYGRNSYSSRVDRSFTESEWIEWLTEVANKYRDGIKGFSRKALAETAAGGELTPDEIRKRLSELIDGFAMRQAHGKLEISASMMAHALGVTLVSRLQSIVSEGAQDLESELTEWLDPISGLDQRAEILRAAVSILVAQGESQSAVTSKLLTAWLQTQNVAESHRLELKGLAPALTKALLDAIESSTPHGHKAARSIAIQSLLSIPRDFEPAKTQVLERAKEWLRVVSLDLDRRPEAAESEKRRAAGWLSRIGTSDPGPIVVVGVQILLVDHPRNGLEGIVSNLIEGYPLVEAIPVFEVAAVALAAKGRSEAWNELYWLSLLNETDPEQAADALRCLANSVCQRQPERGVNPGLPARVAGLLLRLTGHLSDEDAAIAIEVGLDRAVNYERDYLADPARGLFRLERRHAISVLEDATIPLHVRLRRTSSLWLDPTFESPEALREEVESLVAQLDPEKLDRSHGSTAEDHQLEELEPAIARLAPQALANLMRRKLRLMPSAAGDAQIFCAMGARRQLLLAGNEEQIAAHQLRAKLTAHKAGESFYAASVLLMIEIKDLDPIAQFGALIESGLESILMDFLHLLGRPTSEDIDLLVARHSHGSSDVQKNLLALISVEPPKLNETTWRWVSGFAESSDADIQGLAFKTLSSSDAARFGRELSEVSWSWRADAHLWVNHYGSLALIEATRGQSFDEIAAYFAPWLVLKAVRLRGEDPEEIRLAAEILARVLGPQNFADLDTGADISIRRDRADAHPFLYSASARPVESDVDPTAAFGAAFDVQARANRQQRAADVARERIEEARRKGASLFLVNMDAEDMLMVTANAPDLVAQWIEGHSQRTQDFRNRVRRAEAAFLALCEALLRTNPALGTELWRALRETVATRYVGLAGVDELLHMIFRSPPSEPVQMLRTEVLSPRFTRSDAALFDLALAASLSGNHAWLEAVISDDRRSPLAWKQRRSIVLSGFVANSKLPVKGAWPDGEIRTTHAEQERVAARLRAIEACAQHWWGQFLAAPTDADAYAAWILFESTADRRSSVWIRDHIEESKMEDSAKRRIAHAEINLNEMERKAARRANGANTRFLGQKIPEEIGPWA